MSSSNVVVSAVMVPAMRAAVSVIVPVVLAEMAEATLVVAVLAVAAV